MKASGQYMAMAVASHQLISTVRPIVGECRRRRPVIMLVDGVGCCEGASIDDCSIRSILRDGFTFTKSVNCPVWVGRADKWASQIDLVEYSYGDKQQDANGQPLYGLVPNLLPAIGFKYDPDGFNLTNGAKGFTYLQWVDADGNAQTRYYDGAGSRGDGSGETLAGAAATVEMKLEMAA